VPNAWNYRTAVIDYPIILLHFSIFDASLPFIMTEKLAKYDLRINFAGVFESYKDGVWNPPPVLSDYDLLVFTSGVGTIVINGKRHTVSQNDVLLMRRGDRTEEALSSGRISNLLVHFDFLGEDGNLTDPPASVLPPRFPAQMNPVVMAHMTQAVMQKCSRGEPDSAAALLRAILILLAGMEQAKPRDFSVAHRSRLLEDFASRILADPAQQRCVADLAAEAGMSPVQFTRCFREKTGHAPGEFMVLARIERARLLLTTTSRSVADIAFSLGYSDVYYFTRQFTSKTGVPPATYRKTPKGKKKSSSA